MRFRKTWSHSAAACSNWATLAAAAAPAWRLAAAAADSRPFQCRHCFRRRHGVQKAISADCMVALLLHGGRAVMLTSTGKRPPGTRPAHPTGLSTRFCAIPSRIRMKFISCRLQRCNALAVRNVCTGAQGSNELGWQKSSHRAGIQQIRGDTEHALANGHTKGRAGADIRAEIEVTVQMGSIWCRPAALSCSCLSCIWCRPLPNRTHLYRHLIFLPRYLREHALPVWPNACSGIQQ